MQRRHFLHSAAAAAAATLLAAACTYSDVPSIANSPEMLLTEGGFLPPDLEMQLAEGPLESAHGWGHIVVFSGPAGKVEHWVRANFPEGTESRAERDDLPVVVAELGEGVQKQGDRVASGTIGSTTDYVVVISQDTEPTVHVAVWSNVR